MSAYKKQSKKEKTENLISKWAFTILFALCIQFLVYVVILNLVPTMINNETPTQEDYVNAEINSADYGEFSVPTLNSFYVTDNYYTTNGIFKTSIENPTMFIYYYNMVLLVASIILILYYLVNFMENNDGRILQKIKKFLKAEWPFTLLLIFMLWVFISSLLAYDSYRSFIGCFNLKDGYLSFMMYGSMLVCSMLLVKDNDKYKKILVNTFLITATILAIITLWNHFYLNSDKSAIYPWYSLKEGALEDNSVDKGDIQGDYIITYGKDPSKTAVTLGELLFGNGGLPVGENFLIVTKRILGETNSGIFHNSNHYGYYLSICVIVAAVMAMKEKNHGISILYFISYVIMLEMAIINNTLGAYLGIGASVLFMLIYSLIQKEDKSIYEMEKVYAILIVLAFIFASALTTNVDGENIVAKNFSALARDFNILVESAENNNGTKEISGNIENSEDSGNTEVSGNIENSEDSGNTEVSGNIEISETSGNVDTSGNSENKESNENKNAADNIGSGRGILWEKAAIMALQRPLFGYGLENILYQYNVQFGISEGRSHNLVLQLAATTGIVGMLLYVVAIAAIWIRKLKYIKSWDMYECLGMFVIVSYIVSSLVGNSGFYTSGYFYIFVGFVIFSNTNVSVLSNEKSLVTSDKKSKKHN